MAERKVPNLFRVDYDAGPEGPPQQLGLESAAAADRTWDVIIIGAGSAGMPAALFAAKRGAKVLVIEHSGAVGGTLRLAPAQMSAAGTKLQKSLGIDDTPEEHFADAMRISRGTINQDLAKLAIWNAGKMFDWLMDSGFDMMPECPSKGNTHEPFSKARYYWGREFGRSILNVVEPQLMEAVKTCDLTILLRHEALSLIQQNDGMVTGVIAKDIEGVERSYTGRSVVITSGGYAANTTMYEELSGQPQYQKWWSPFSQGRGHQLGLSAGAYLRGIENFMASFGVILESDQYPAKAIGRPNSYPEVRQPWEIYVNALGQRFVCEDLPSVDAREHALLKQPGMRYWVIFDQEILDQAPPVVEGWTQDQVKGAFGSTYSFYKGQSLAELAAAAGIDAKGLKDTVDLYNYGIGAGHDVFARKHCPLPIGKPPFYAIRAQGCAITGAAGLAVDTDLRVIRRDGSAIPGLYAAGEILGAGVLQGNAYVGGMMVTPALTFGKLLGEKILPLGNQ
ncbi:MAG: FAD-binding protein [Rhodospirillaceae bacterium]